MNPAHLEILVCPVCKGSLKYHADKQELWSTSSKLAFPVRDGIPVMMADEARELSDLECRQ